MISDHCNLQLKTLEMSSTKWWHVIDRRRSLWIPQFVSSVIRDSTYVGYTEGVPENTPQKFKIYTFQFNFGALPHAQKCILGSMFKFGTFITFPDLLTTYQNMSVM